MQVLRVDVFFFDRDWSEAAISSSTQNGARHLRYRIHLSGPEVIQLRPQDARLLKGEGFCMVFVQPLAMAIQNGNTVRAVVRANSSNQMAALWGSVSLVIKLRRI